MTSEGSAYDSLKQYSNVAGDYCFNFNMIAFKAPATASGGASGVAYNSRCSDRGYTKKVWEVPAGYQDRIGNFEGIYWGK
eukprot:CAMPEP_0117049698 /NCGR_PEP_ID=MMETSP0472-20121206/34318_1 /TAXON_ID=693140 ORGANISM="Tiarina fusus, Strain LIS" /NCGR_SAMPLE_ID=MMETSP0472 /ASSEMBLY_ACC=CAM_ASM_000603 /LENGTH=79 /DNA_ID=CAMNT_0004763207 /DNA_START=8 /DNA_END=247 /DNA_ORIENTATION=-